MIVVTGAAGFIGSCLVSRLNSLDIDNIILVDDFSSLRKNKNLEHKRYKKKIERTVFIDWFSSNAGSITSIYHIGARTDTTEFDVSIFDNLNLNYSKSLWDICVDNNISFIYASSAATYGTGEFGFDDNHELIDKLEPLNPYGESKNDFDKWVLLQDKQPPFWAGFKFFNVYGPNEFHKDRMGSVVINAVNQIKKTGSMTLFRSHNPSYQNGEQARDFIYVKDIVEVLVFMIDNKIQNGIYNLGTGTARTFNDLAQAIFKSMNIESNIIFIDTPVDIRDKYQYFTEAKMLKLRSIGYNTLFTELEDGVKDYIQEYLIEKKYY